VASFSASVSIADIVTLNFQANELPPLATLPHAVGPYAISANFSAGQKPYTALYKVSNSDDVNGSTFRYVDYLVNRLIVAFSIMRERPTTTIDLWLSRSCVNHKATAQPVADTVEFRAKLINWNVSCNFRIFN
jgi:hypothetical protein